MTNQLLRCPFCGAQPKRESGRTVSNQFKAAIRCRGCNAIIERFTAGHREVDKQIARERAESAWNTRSGGK